MTAARDAARIAASGPTGRAQRVPPGCYVVASGFGTSAQWYRNVLANPHVRTNVHSRRPAAATASVLTAKQGADALGAYAFAHPHAWRTVKPVFEATLGAEIGVRATTLPLVALDQDPTVGPLDEPSPPTPIGGPTRLEVPAATLLPTSPRAEVHADLILMPHGLATGKPPPAVAAISIIISARGRTTASRR